MPRKSDKRNNNIHNNKIKRMKRFLLPLIALMLSVSITNAQSGVKLNTKQAPIGTLQKNGNAMPAVPGMNKQKAAKAPAKIQLAENQKIMGPYTTDELGQYGLGLTNKPGNLPIAAILDANNIKKFNGGKVTAIRFGLCYATKVNKVFIKALKNGNFEDLFEQEFTGNTVVGWNTVTIENPYTLDLNGVDALLLGFEYVQTTQGNAAFPLSFASKETATAAYTDFGEGLDWYTISGAGGSLSVQAIVEKEYPAADIVVNDVYSMEFVKPGDKIQYGFSYYNDGTAPISVYSFGIAIDGNEVAVIEAPTKDLTTTAKNYSGMLEAQNLPVGYHTLSVYVKQMNNETPADASNGDTKLGVYTESLQRQKHLLEHFTSQYCTYCPAGINLLEYLNKQRDDLAWVSLHGNMNGGVDMFTIPEGTDIMGLMTGGFPSAAFDRFPLGDGDIAIGIGVQDSYIPTYANEISRILDQIGQQYPVFATVDITAKVNETGNLDIKVSGETTKEFAALMGNEAAITVYVTEDSIVARQLNNGIWKSKYTHNSVLRKVVTDTYGTKLNVEGNKYENNYNVTLPDGWNKKNLNAVAFIGNAITDENLANGNIWVTNANCVKADYSTTGISTPTASAENRPVEYYTLDGIRIETPAKGLNIVKLSNGEVRKIMIK